MRKTGLGRRKFLQLPMALGVAQVQARASEAPLGPGAADIVDQMARAYADCKTYQDRGRHVMRFAVDGRSMETVRPFATAFVRPDRFRFEFSDAYFKEAPWQRYVVWCAGTDVRVWWDVRPGVEHVESFGEAVAGATGISGGTAHTVPSLLMPDRIDGGGLLDLPHLQRLEDAVHEGVSCWRLQGVPADGSPEDEHERRQESLRVTGRDPGPSTNGPTTLWIEASTGLLRRLDERTQIGETGYESMTVYEPLMNAPVDEALLDFGFPAP